MQRLEAFLPLSYPMAGMLTNSGAEAAENALKVARAATGRTAVIAFDGGFHGRTLLGVTLTGMSQPYKQNFGPFPAEIYHATYPNEYRGVSSDDALAERYLRQADERGMWFAPALADNDDFEHLRGTPFFKQVLANTQARYAKVSVGKVGAISVLPPSKGVAMPACAPVLVWLHGYGINGHLDSSEQPLADAGVVLLGINGTEMRESFDSFSWTGPYEGTHKVVQAGLEQLAARQCIDRKQVYLMGFSQGSQHAGALLAQHPDDYAGALLVSPGGWRQPVPTQSSAHGKRVFVINGEQEGPANQKMSADFRALFSDGNELRSRTHEGGHFYPDDWKTSFPQAIRWLMGKDG